jgi:hypothetical protein
MWHALIGVESMNETPVHSPKQHIFRKIAIGMVAFCCSSTKRL